MIRKNTPYIVVPMEAMDKILQQVGIFRANCPEHLKESLEFALGRFEDTALYMHGRDNINAKTKPAGYNFGLKRRR